MRIIFWRLARTPREGVLREGFYSSVSAKSWLPREGFFSSVSAKSWLPREGLHSHEAADPRGGVVPLKLVGGSSHGPSGRWTVVPPVPLNRHLYTLVLYLCTLLCDSLHA
jgi:hypothetical protein